SNILWEGYQFTKRYLTARNMQLLQTDCSLKIIEQNHQGNGILINYYILLRYTESSS
ncbi:hypothetical protein WUBG_18308, partial [Wuchereria bancrofti]